MTDGESGAATEKIRWRSVHKITPLLNAWKVAVALLTVGVIQGLDDLQRLPLSVIGIIGVVAGAVLISVLVSLIYSYLAWRRLRFAITDESVLVRSGVLFRSEKETRLTRVQSVEITQPILGRIFGFSALRVEAAGSESATLTLQYLSHDQAASVRNEILARSAGVAVGSKTVDAPVASEPAELVPEAPQRQVFEVSTPTLLGSLLASGTTVALLLVVIAIVTGGLISGSWEFVFGVLFGLLALGGALWGRFSSDFGLRVAVSPDGLRVRHGLLETKARTIPPGRIQSISITQPPLWRGFGWWRVKVALARQSSDGSDIGQTLLPVGTQEEARYLLALALPGLLADESQALMAGFTGSGPAEEWVPSPARARWFDPLAYRRNAFRVFAVALGFRRGRWWRSLTLVPHARTQSLGLTQGPFDRRMALVAFETHIASGVMSPRLPHIDPDIASVLLAEQSERARLARRSAGPEHWMETESGSGTDGAGPGT